jgi:hypothetical protein
MKGESPVLDRNIEQILDRVRRVDAVTRGIPKISYLVGWHHDGHDSKYPDWSEVNPRLRRDGDRSATESLIWLMEQGRRYNTTLSLHINMLDAYETSPLWREYLDHEVLARHQGELYRCPWAVWDGEQAYWIDYAREWDCGLARRRIDGLLAMLPIREMGTIHIDAFYVPDHTDVERQKSAMRKIFRYWRDCGVDVTSEMMFYRRHGEPFLGLQPMAWHINGWGTTWEKPEIGEDALFEIPPALFCGGTDHLALQHGQLFGTSLQGTEFQDGDDFRKPFCLQTLPWYFLNRYDRLRLEREQDGTRTLVLSDGIVSRVTGDGRRTVRQDGRLLVDGTDVCVPALWRPHRELIAFSETGYTRRAWALPPDWHDVRAADVYTVSADGMACVGAVNLTDGQLTLSLCSGQMASVVPAGTEKVALEAPGCASRTNA